jgi:hypothetical protein
MSEVRNTYKILVGKSQDKIAFGKHRRGDDRIT